MTSRTMRTIAAVPLAASIVFWLWFGIASALGEKLGAGNWIAHLLVPGGLLLGFLAVAWRWSNPGGMLLVLAGVFVCVGYPLTVGQRFPVSTSVFVVALMGLPPLLGGALFIGAERLARREREAGP